jgi:hypothetical protein
MSHKIILVSLALSLAFNMAFAQRVQYSKIKTNTQERMSPTTDTLNFVLPNGGKVSIRYNNTHFNKDELDSTFRKTLASAHAFPADLHKVYTLDKNWYQHTPQKTILDIQKNYYKHLTSIELGLPFGLDFTAGNFTPEIGFRFHLQFPGFAIGSSITNSILFSNNVEGNTTVHSNYFANLEYSINRGSLWANNTQTIQLGYLISQQGNLFEGHTVKAVYRQRIKGYMQFIGGVVGTNDLKTYYPIIGIRFL